MNASEPSAGAPFAAAMRGALAGFLVAGIALPEAGRFCAAGLLALAGLAFVRHGATRREIPPALLAAFLCLLLALAHARLAGGAPNFDRLCALAAATLLSLFAPFYLADRLPPLTPLVAGCFTLAFARHFELAAVHLSAGGSLAPAPAAAAALPATPAAALLLVAVAPALDRLRPPLARFPLEAAWHALFLAAALGRPGAAVAVLAALALVALAGRRVAPARRLAVALLLLALALGALDPAGGAADRVRSWLGPERAAVAAALQALDLAPGEVAAEAGPGFAALPTRQPPPGPDGRLDEAEFARLPAALLFPLGPGIPVALLVAFLHLLLVRRAARALSRLPADDPAGDLAAAGAGIAAALSTLLLFTAEPLLSGSAAPFLFLCGSALARDSRPVDPIPRRAAERDRGPGAASPQPPSPRP